VGPSRLYAFLLRWWWLTFLLMGLCFVLFGLLSLNLLHTLGANLEFLGMHGVDAVREGGLQQLGELIATGYAAALFYVCFKLCERALVERLAASRSRGIES
jgi:hypothetical protein